MTDEPDHSLDRPIAVTPRPLADYRQMFLLTDADLVAGRILDCPGGSSPFGSQVRARGGKVLSVDPVYGLSRHELDAVIRSDLAQLMARIEADADAYDWSYLGSPDMLRRYFDLASELFLTDYQANRAHYIAAALPVLPFDDRRFQLTLSSHFLFGSADYPTFPAQLSAIRELMRVTEGELRIFPVVGLDGRPYPRMAALRAALAVDGIATELRPADCRYVIGSDDLLACWWDAA